MCFYKPFTESIDVDITKLLFAAVEELPLSGQALKLDLIVIVHLLPNCLHFDVRMKAENAPNTVLSL